MKRFKRAIVYSLLAILMLGAAGAYIYIQLFIKRADYASARDDIRNALTLGDRERSYVERAYAYYVQALRLADQALGEFDDPLKVSELETFRRVAERKRDTVWEILRERHKNYLKFVQRRQVKLNEVLGKEGAAVQGRQLVATSVQTFLDDELMRAVYVVKPEEVWTSYLQVLSETKPSTDSPLHIAVRQGQMQQTLAAINKQRLSKKLAPVRPHYFGNPETLKIDPVTRKFELKFADAKVPKIYKGLYNNPPDEFQELELMRLRYIHRAVREQLEMQIDRLMAELRPVSKLAAPGREWRVTNSERAKARKTITTEIIEMIKDGRLELALRERKIEWTESLPRGTAIEHEIIWPAVEPLVEERNAMDFVLNQVRSIILRPLRKYPAGLEQAELYISWLKESEFIHDETRKSEFEIVKRWRPIDIFFNTPDGYVVYSLFFPPEPAKKRGWRADCAASLRQEIDAAWLPIGVQVDGQYVKEWLRSQEEKKNP